MNIRKSDKGFTIIEVVIVLAIAGLIFAIVFWALPNLQKNQRDNDRRTVVSNVLANLDQYQANSNGDYPELDADMDSFLEFFYECPDSAFTDGAVLNAACSLEDPLADQFTLFFNETTDTALKTITSTDPVGTLVISTVAQCPDTPGDPMVAGAGGRAIAIQVKLENGISYCTDNN